ncbi:hypothetical protein FACS189427_04600 [Planctomycetales bacterium]|nr:hypothetical protein FACS189427_04600 [Planctomycetales bacterium]
MPETRNDFLSAMIEHMKRNHIDVPADGQCFDKIEKNVVNTDRFDREWDEAQGEISREIEKGGDGFFNLGSSCALIVNNFLPWKNEKIRKNGLQLEGLNDFEKPIFEKTQSTGLMGTPPHLDMFMQNATDIFAFESKFLEPLETVKNHERYRYFSGSYFTETEHYCPSEFWKKLASHYEEKDTPLIL